MLNLFYSILAVTVSISLYGSEISLKGEMMESQTVENPKYLYKILSYRHWQVTQNRKTVELSSEDDPFIHFAKEDQLDKIIAKYWSDAPQFAILKIDTDKLEGELVYEANPGGRQNITTFTRDSSPLIQLSSLKLSIASLLTLAMCINLTLCKLEIRFYAK